MKKITLLILYLFIGIFVFAQKASVLLTEDFSGSFPPTGWTIDNLSSQWSQSTGTNAGGTAPEAKLTYTSGIYITHLISPLIDLTGFSSVIFSFKHFLNDYSGLGYMIGVATRSGGSSWNDVWTVNPTGDMGPETNDIIISNADVGASDFQICIYLSGNMYNFNYWYIDDLKLISPDNNDAAMESINVSPYSASGNLQINCTLKNIGLLDLTSTDLNYQIDNGTIITETLSGLSITTLQTNDYVFSSQWSALPGNYNLKIWVSNVNGNGNDDDQTNDTLNLSMHIATQSVLRIPLYEEFTSSTCSPCAIFNSNYFTNNFLSSNDGNYTLVKYQMNWPIPGDPYYTEEGGDRRDYYGVSGVPTLFLDAQEGTAFDAGILQSNLDYQLTVPSFFSLSANSQIAGSEIYINANLTPYVDAANFTVHLVAVEQTTTENTGNNGETEFHYVMMKMLPDASGTTLNFTSGTPVNISQNTDMSSTYTEEMKDLKFIVFIQNNDTKEVFQSAWAPVTNFSVFSPVNGSTNIYLDNNIVIEFSSAAIKTDDTEITSENISDFIHLNNLVKGNLLYTAEINTDKTVITINPIENFSPSTVINCTLDSDAIKDTSNITFKEASVSFTTGTETGINNTESKNIKIYPNPANQEIYISGTEKAHILVFDISGKHVLSANILNNQNRINISSLNTGIYTLKIISDGNVITTKITVIK